MMQNALVAYRPPRQEDTDLLKEYREIEAKRAVREMIRWAEQVRQEEQRRRRDRNLARMYRKWKRRIIVWAVLGGIACALAGALVVMQWR